MHILIMLFSYNRKFTKTRLTSLRIRLDYNTLSFHYHFPASAGDNNLGAFRLHHTDLHAWF